ncbi:MAG: hypothetical protein KatS3mg115_0450 [Candidatus Poribacteria bacterium]|nr:MAG: hypothetical protein KatS3mg115_0450 [Candidatus Poribacteria bacterium]
MDTRALGRSQMIASVDRAQPGAGPLRLHRRVGWDLSGKQPAPSRCPTLLRPYERQVEQYRQQLLRRASGPRPRRRGKRWTPLGYRIVLLGDPSCPSGSYLLRIQTSAPDRFPFGRFRGGKEIFVPPGEYLYVGSALARRGGVSLARRLLRHASRSAEKPPHPIRDLLLAAFQQQGIGGTELLPRRKKTLHWNVDHLLDRPTAELVGVYAVRSSLRMERELGQMIEQGRRHGAPRERPWRKRCAGEHPYPPRPCWRGLVGRASRPDGRPAPTAPSSR